MKKILVRALIVVVVLVVVASVILPQLGRGGHGESRKVRDASNLAQLGKAANMWLLSHGQNKYWPPSLLSLYTVGIVREPKVFLCPKPQEEHIKMGDIETDYECILDLIPRMVTEEEATSDTPFAWDKKGCFGDGRNVVFFDSHVEFIPGEENFQKFYNEKIAPFVEAQKKKAAEEKMKALESENK